MTKQIWYFSDITVYFRNNAKYSYNLILDNLIGLNDAALNRELTAPNETTIYEYAVFSINISITNRALVGLLVWTLRPLLYRQIQ